MFNLKYALQHYPTGQKRTGKNKKYTFLHNDKVIKGPYKLDKIIRIIDVSNSLKRWTKPEYPDMLVHPCVDEQNRVIIYQDEDKNYYITFDNVAKEYIQNSEVITESFTGIQHQVIKRNGVEKFNDVFEQVGAWLNDQIKYIVLYSCLMYVLGVGDTGLHNILIDQNKQKLYIIDYEDHRQNIGEGDFFYFTKNPRKSIKERWLQNCNMTWVINELKSFNNNDINIIIAAYEDKRGFYPFSSLVINGINDTNENKYIISKYNDSNNSNNSNNSNSKDNNSKDNKDNNSKVKDSNKIKIKISAKPVNSSIGKMINKGMNGGSLTFSGLDVGAVRSGVQKYIRRNETVKAIMCGVEMYRMIEVDCKALQSNLFNRLAIIAAEDIGPANVELMLKMIKINLDDNRDIYQMVSMIQLMSQSSKTRIMSHLYRAYCHPDGMKIAQEKGLDIQDQYDTNFIQNHGLTIFKPEDPNDLMVYTLMMYKRLTSEQQDQRVKALYWLGYFIRDMDKYPKVGARNRKTKPLVIVWAMLQLLMKPRTWEILMKACFKLSESRPFYMAAFTMLIYDITENNNNDIDISLDQLTKCWTNHEFLTQLLQGQHTLQLDDYVIDMHTKEGRKQGKNRQDFVQQGATIELQDLNLYDPILEQIYINS